MEEIKKRFKNAISLVFVNKYDLNNTELSEIKEDTSPYELFNQFFKEQNNPQLIPDHVFSFSSFQDETKYIFLIKYYI